MKDCKVELRTTGGSLFLHVLKPTPATEMVQIEIGLKTTKNKLKYLETDSLKP